MAPPDGPDDEPSRAGGAVHSRLSQAKPVTAVRRRYQGSAAQDVGRRLSALDFVNQATLLGAGLLASLLPLLILLSAFANSRVDDDIALRLGLDHRAARIVENLFHAASPTTVSVATVSSLIFVAAGTIAVASSLQQTYEKIFGQPHRGARDLPRLLVWVAAICCFIAFESLIGRPVRNAPGGRILVVLVTIALLVPFFWWTMHFLLAGRVRWQDLFRPAATTGVLFAGFGAVSELYFSASIIFDSRIYGPIGAVLSLLTWLIAIGCVLILGPLAGAVWQQRRVQA